jgi:TolA-binding protein
MKRISVLTPLLLLVLLSSTRLPAVNLLRPDEIGGQMVGTRKDASQIPGSGIGPGLALFFRYNLSPRLLLDISSGYATATDDIMATQLAEAVLFPNLTVKTTFKALADARLTPVFQLGFMGAHTYYHSDGTLFSPEVVDIVSNDVCLLAGTGLVYKSYFNFNITFNADYRHGVYSGNPVKPKYWVVETGISFILNKKESQPDFQEDFYIPQDEANVAVTEVPETRSEPMSIDRNDELAVFLYKVENLLGRIEDKQKQLEELEARVIANERAIATVTGFVASEFVNYTDVNDQPQPEAAPSTDEYYMNLYQTALSNFNTQNYGLAQRQFEQLLQLNDSHPLASNCQFWIGECYHNQRDFANAADAYGKVLNYHLSSKYDDALMKSGLCHVELGDTTRAKEIFSELLSEHPESEFVTQASGMLNTL